MLTAAPVHKAHAVDIVTGIDRYSMNRLNSLLLLGLLFPLASQSATIYRCTRGTYIAYQNFACPSGLEQTVMDRIAPRPVAKVDSLPQTGGAEPTSATPGGPPLPDPAQQLIQEPQQPAREPQLRQQPREPVQPIEQLPQQPTRPSLAFQNKVLKLGMSDDEVLNLPRWGVPDKIVRSKGNHSYHEEWIYVSRVDAPKRLSFDNAKLTAIDTDPAPAQQMASVYVRQAPEIGVYSR
jgi:hypothetical protein